LRVEGGDGLRGVEFGFEEGWVVTWR
jgi:hypothetical protein